MDEGRKTYFEKLQVVFQDKNYSKNTLKITLRDIQVVLSFKGGLFNNELRVLAQFLCATDLSSAINEEIVKCLVPREPVSDDILDKFLVVIFSRQKTPTHLKLSGLLLQWLLSVLDFGFAKQETFQENYHLFFRLLQYKELNSYACKMIYKLTNPIDVTEITIKRIMKYYEDCKSHSKIIYMDALIKYFDAYKPNSIDSKMIKDNINVKEVFENLQQESSNMFALVLGVSTQRSCALVPIVGLQDVIVHEEVQMNTSQLKVNRLIPPVNYSFPLDGKLSILPFESVEQLGHYVVTVAVPDQILSLLYKEVGFFKLITCDEADQKRFAQRLLDTLKEVFWEKTLHSSVEEETNFLEQMYSLCNFMQQGIALCTNFIDGFLLTWSGLDYRSQILHLIEWVVVDTYAELSSILKSLRMLFVTSDITMKSQIINTLANLVGNMGKAFSRVKKGIDQPFLKSQIPAWTASPISMFRETNQFVGDLIQIGLCLNPESLIFLDVAVSFYETVSCYEDVLSLPVLTFAPKGVMCQCFANRNIKFLDRIAGLLLNYQKQIQRLQAEGVEVDFFHQTDLCDLFIQDIVNTVWTGEALSRAGHGMIFKNLPPEMFRNIVEICPNNPNSLFDLPNHFSILAALIRERKTTGRNLLSEEDIGSMGSRYNILQIYANKVLQLMDQLHPKQYLQ